MLRMLAVLKPLYTISYMAAFQQQPEISLNTCAPNTFYIRKVSSRSPSILVTFQFQLSMELDHPTQVMARWHPVLHKHLEAKNQAVKHTMASWESTPASRLENLCEEFTKARCFLCLCGAEGSFGIDQFMGFSTQDQEGLGGLWPATYFGPLGSSNDSKCWGSKVWPHLAWQEGVAAFSLD